MPKYHIWTIGCQMNRAESERLGSLLEQMGYQPAATAEESDLVVLNSCVVRQSAENRVVGRLDALKALKRARPALTLAVTGCLVNSDQQKLIGKFPHVDHFFKPGEYPQWLSGQEQPPKVLPDKPSPSTFVPITQGCNNSCSYCIVPHRRGREKSRAVAEILGEVEELARRGVKEVILLGQNVDSYGHDLSPSPDLAELLGELNAAGGIARIRFLTSHPRDMSLKLIEAIANFDKVCEYISLPVQSGDNDILKAMKRGYTVEHFRRLISQIRRRIPGVALSTDVIVGFPGESEAQFQQTLKLLRELKFDTVHVAAYSPREGTLAAREYEDNIPSAEKKERLHTVEQLQGKIAAEINSRLLGRTLEVLVEGRKKGRWQGRTRGGKLVFFDSNGDLLGQLVDVRIDRVSPWALQGKPETGIIN